MSKLPYRQVHLDFHTSEKIEGIGKRFSKENFAAALREGHVNSITLFSKCHHGWAYHPSTANKQHPNLDFDLLGAQLEVCRELGVRTEIYLSAGFDEKYAVEHKDQIIQQKNGYHWPFDEPGYHRLCLNTPYLDSLCAQVDEVMTKYEGLFDGIFLDIITATPCYCDYCRKGMAEEGVDIENPAEVYEYAKRVYQKYCDAIDKVVFAHDPNMPIIHNDGGALFQGRRVAFRNPQHFEIESLPTGGWGYDHFPRAAAYARTLGKEFLGMTGKFHRTWGEFGGYKHPNALRYEAMLSNLCGAKCSVGDQLHPDGEMDLSTYRLIGKAYSEVEAREPWMTDSMFIADIGLLSAEGSVNSAYAEDFDVAQMIGGGIDQDIGANRMMLEGHYLYNVIDPEEDFSKYKLLILPDNISTNGAFKEKLDAYLAAGGKLLLSGRSGVGRDGRFAINFGGEFGGEAEFNPCYLRPEYELYPNGITSYIMYGKCYKLALNDSFAGDVRALRMDSYFNRTAEHFCSHYHTPYNKSQTDVGAVVTDNVGYIAWEIFSEYAKFGAAHLKYAVFDIIDRLLGGEKTLATSLGSLGVTALMKQSAEGGERLVNYLAYAPTKLRGVNTEIIEDIPPVLDTKVTVRVDKKPTRVYIAPDGTELDFTYADGKISYVVPRFECSALVVIE